MQSHMQSDLLSNIHSTLALINRVLLDAPSLIGNVPVESAAELRTAERLLIEAQRHIVRADNIIRK